MKVYEFITNNENREFCKHCSEICSSHCAIYRKASQRYDAAERRSGTVGALNKRYGIGCLLLTLGGSGLGEAITSGRGSGLLSTILFAVGFGCIISSYIKI